MTTPKATPTAAAPTDEELTYIAHLAASLKPDKNCIHCHGQRGYSALAVDTTQDGSRRVRLILCCGKPKQTEYALLRDRVNLVADSLGATEARLVARMERNTATICATTFWGGIAHLWRKLFKRNA